MIDFSRPDIQQAIADANTGWRPEDLASLALVENEEDFRAILRGYEAAGIPTPSPSFFDKAMIVLAIVSQIAGEVIPIVGLASSIRHLLSP
jgi:hypothetical protein